MGKFIKIINQDGIEMMFNTDYLICVAASKTSYGSVVRLCAGTQIAEEHFQTPYEEIKKMLGAD